MEDAIARTAQSSESSAATIALASNNDHASLIPATSQQKAWPRSISRYALAGSSALLLVLSFPDFNLWPLAWIALVPLLLSAAESRRRGAFIQGWLCGGLFFYASCHWVTYSIINYGHLSTWLAYLLIVPAALLLGIFPALFALSISHLVRRWGPMPLLFAPALWSTLEW